MSFRLQGRIRWGRKWWAYGETLPRDPKSSLSCPPASHLYPGGPDLENGLGQTNGAQRGLQRGGLPVGRAGHPRARRSSSQVPAMALLRGEAGPSCRAGVWAVAGGARKTASQATGPAAPRLLHRRARAVSPREEPPPLPPWPSNPVLSQGPGSQGATPTPHSLL